MESAGKFKKRILPHQDQIKIQNKNCEQEKRSCVRQKPHPNTRNKKPMNQVLKDDLKINGIKFYYCNADILTSDKKKELIQDVEKQQPHIVAICEVKPKHGTLRELHEYEFKDYKVVCHTNMDTNIGRGIIVLAHSSVQHLIVNVTKTTINSTSLKHVS